MDPKDPPAGGTRTEMAYQIAVDVADQGYCEQAMPMFVCLASLGPGWEVAAHRAGQCARSAAENWKPMPELAKDHAKEPISEDAQPLRRKGFLRKKNRRPLRYDFQKSPKRIQAEGMRQLRRAANANWPDSQALLSKQLSDAGGNDMAEARHWMDRYDQNTRRKVYGGDMIPYATRLALKAVQKSGAGGVMWRPVAFASEPDQPFSCYRMLGTRGPGRMDQLQTPEPEKAIEDDDLEKTTPLPVPEETNEQRPETQRQQRPMGRRQVANP